MGTAGAAGDLLAIDLHQCALAGDGVWKTASRVCAGLVYCEPHFGSTTGAGGIGTWAISNLLLHHSEQFVSSAPKHIRLHAHIRAPPPVSAARRPGAAAVGAGGEAAPLSCTPRATAFRRPS